VPSWAYSACVTGPFRKYVGQSVSAYGNHLTASGFVHAGNQRKAGMANRKQDNPNPKPQDDQRQGGRDPLGKVQDPRQEGQGRDPMKDPARQRGGETDQRKQGGQHTRKPT
jgi:hypothetical protein